MGVTCIAVQSNFRVSGSGGSSKGNKRNAEEVDDSTGIYNISTVLISLIILIHHYPHSLTYH